MTKAAMDIDHRWGERRPVVVQVRLLGHANQAVEGVLTDLSISGAYVRVQRILPPLSRVLLMPVMAATRSSWVRPLLAYIVRWDAAGVGLEFAQDLPTSVNGFGSSAWRQVAVIE